MAQDALASRFSTISSKNARSPHCFVMKLSYCSARAGQTYRESPIIRTAVPRSYVGSLGSGLIFPWYRFASLLRSGCSPVPVIRRNGGFIARANNYNLKENCSFFDLNMLPIYNISFYQPTIFSGPPFLSLMKSGAVRCGGPGLRLAHTRRWKSMVYRRFREVIPRVI
jgi:hypothetical protein